MRLLGCTYALLALLACQASASDAVTPPTPAPDREIVARDRGGARIASITSAHPCRVETAVAAVTVPAVPFALDVAGAHWASETAANGTVLTQDGALAARALEAHGTLSVFAPTGAAWIRVDAQGDVHGAGGELLRSLRADATGWHDGDATVTGTDDVYLAAILTAPELPATVRALVACNRLLSNEVTPK